MPNESSLKSHQLIREDYDLRWLLVESPALMGERSTFEGVVAAIERGGDSGNRGTKGVGRIVRLPDWAEREQDADVDRERELTAAWKLMERSYQEEAVARYLCASSREIPEDMRVGLGQMAGVGWLLSRRAQDTRRELKEATRSKAWGKLLEASELATHEMHGAWLDCRALVARGLTR